MGGTGILWIQKRSLLRSIRKSRSAPDSASRQSSTLAVEGSFVQVRSLCPASKKFETRYTLKVSAIIEVEKLLKVFGTVRAVDGLSFHVEEGTITGLLGPNGAGKTTTIQMLLDLITPTSGRIRILGKEYRTAREDILSQLNFSSPYVSLPGNLTVYENLLTFGRLYGVQNLREEIERLADFFEIRTFLKKLTYHLSTGQLTRLNLTKALLNQPKLLLLDEPTASLDPDIADRTRVLLKRIQKERGVTILYTSHNMDEVEEICDNVIFIQHGRFKDEGTPAELVKKYCHEDLNDVFLHIARSNDEERHRNS
ncbi:MAG TPA: ABC transporter ATP-binding protein [Candidatus Taylorbacteria bacterium]|nr:ABC transporter ATP-binding protein [Candidatus Taylorbacteria bacterium]